MTQGNNKPGSCGEEIAVEHLKKNRYEILFRNYRCAFGEIDIIARERKTLVFVEVKSRRTSRYGSAAEAVPKTKQRKISRAAMEFVQRYKMEDRPARFDVVAVQLQPQGHTVDIIRDAFELVL